MTTTRKSSPNPGKKRDQKTTTDEKKIYDLSGQKKESERDKERGQIWKVQKGGKHIRRPGWRRVCPPEKGESKGTNVESRENPSAFRPRMRGKKKQLRKKRQCCRKKASVRRYGERKLAEGHKNLKIWKQRRCSSPNRSPRGDRLPGGDFRGKKTTWPPGRRGRGGDE